MPLNLTSAGTYFDTLHQLLLESQVTDDIGNTLSLDEGTDKCVQLVLDTKSHGKKAMLMGNGGSAAIVSHIQNDLCKSVEMRALVFNEPSLLTALANDHGYACVFDRPIALWAEPNDLVIAISSSGQSESILRPVHTARELGCRIITLSGHRSENPLRRLGDLNFYVNSMEYGYVEVAHMAWMHCISDTAMASLSVAPLF